MQDYLGIVLSIFGTIVSATYFGSYDDLLFKSSYITLFIVCAMIVFRVLLREDIDGPGAAPQRYFSFHSWPSSSYKRVLELTGNTAIES